MEFRSWGGGEGLNSDRECRDGLEFTAEMTEMECGEPNGLEWPGQPWSPCPRAVPRDYPNEMSTDDLAHKRFTLLTPHTSPHIALKIRLLQNPNHMLGKS